MRVRRGVAGQAAQARGLEHEALRLGEAEQVAHRRQIVEAARGPQLGHRVGGVPAHRSAVAGERALGGEELGERAFTRRLVEHRRGDVGPRRGRLDDDVRPLRLRRVEEADGVVGAGDEAEGGEEGRAAHDVVYRRGRAGAD